MRTLFDLTTLAKLLNLKAYFWDSSRSKPICDWKAVLSQFVILFGERMQIC
jgi:hypothetical protein